MRCKRVYFSFTPLRIGLSVAIAGACLWAAINRGTIRGTVTDPQGLFIPTVRINITNTDTGVEQTTATNSAGFYLVSELVPGPYRVRLAASGFVLMEFTSVIVKANDTTTVDAQLQVGSEAQAIQVTAANPLVETAAANFGTQVEQVYVQDMPLVGRDIQSLAALIPGVTQSQGPPGTLVGFSSQFTGFPDPTHITGSQVAANGSQASANVWYLDGNLNSAQGMDNVVVDPAPDAVGEFQAVTNAFAPEYGRNAGAVFNVVLKSGTNSPHGSLYEYNRNSYFHARNPFAGLDAYGKPIPPDYINWNQFGGTFGGPVVIPKIYNGKNRTFFFGAWDVSLLHGRANGIFTVPTLAMHQGDFSEVPSVRQFGIYDPMTTTYNSSLGYFRRQPFPGTKLAANRIDPAAQWFMDQFPAPNYLDPRQQSAATGGCLDLCNNYQSSYGSGQTTHNAVVKMDHEIGNRNKLFVEWLYNPTTYSLLTLPWKGATAPLIGFNGSFPFNVGNTIMALGTTTTFSPTLINEFRFSYSRQSTVALPVPNSLGDIRGTLDHLKGLNIPVNPPLQPVPIFVMGGYNFFGAPFNNIPETTEGYTLMDSATKVFSKHAVKAGFLYRVDQSGTEFPVETQLNFFGGLTNNPATGAGGYGAAQFLLGAVDQGSYARYFFPTFSTTKQWAFYVQDEFRISRKLTLNYGLRYEIYGWFKDRFNNESVFDFNRPTPGLPGRKGAIVYAHTAAHPDPVIFPSNKNDFAPRLNFAYAATSKTVVRGGVDIIYSNGLTQVQGQGAGPSEAPGYNQYIFWNGDATGQNLNATSQVPAFLLSRGAPTLPPFQDPKALNLQFLGIGGGFLTPVKNSHDPYTSIWNLQIQRALPGNMVVTVGYVGSKGNFLVGDLNRNYNYVSTSEKLKYRSKLNQLVPMPADLVPLFGKQYFQSQLLMQYPQVPYIINVESFDLSSSYNGLQAKVEKRFSYGLNFLAAYSFQKTIADPGIGGYLSNTWVGGPSFGSGRGRIGQVDGGNGGHTSYWGAIYQDPDNRHLDRGLAPDDIPQIFNVGWTYELPVGKTKPLASNSRGIVNAVIGGWKISGNFNAQMGVPLAINGPCNSLTCRVNLVGNPSAGRSQKNRYQQELQWFNPNAFQPVFGMDPAIVALATTGTPDQKDLHDEFWRFGTAGVRLGGARSPGFWNVDASLGKEFKITETKGVQFRLEAFNALNHQNLGLPNTNFCLPPNADGSTDAVHQFGCQFGWISNVQTDPRSLQFLLRFRF